MSLRAVDDLRRAAQSVRTTADDTRAEAQRVAGTAVTWTSTAKDTWQRKLSEDAAAAARTAQALDHLAVALDQHAHSAENTLQAIVAAKNKIMDAVDDVADGFTEGLSHANPFTPDWAGRVMHPGLPG